jgi:hypothetical protein
MTPTEPFLVLISPSVADLGYAQVIAESINQPSSGFDDLQQQCDYLQKVGDQNDTAACIAVERKVTQWSTSKRKAPEWLVCSALPQDLEATDKIRDVLGELWAQVYDLENEASADWLKKATQKHGSVFQAPRMTEITQTFRSHPQIRGITWVPIIPPPSKSPQPPKKSRDYKMKTLIALIGLLAVWGATSVSKKKGAANDPQTGAPVLATPSQDDKNWSEWNEVLSGDDRWMPLLEATGGKEAFKAWETAKKAAATEADQSGGLKSLFGSLPKVPKEPDAHILQQQQQAVKKLDEWMTLYGKEFNISGSRPKEVADTPMTKYLMGASPPWHRNINRQIIQQGPELSFLENAGKNLEEFVSMLGKPDSSDAPKLLRAIWNALGAFSKSNPNDDIESFRDVVKRELEGMPAPPENYTILTLKDVERVKRLQIIFGSEEFGLIVTGRRFQKEERWDIIKKSVVSAIAQIERMTGPERALLEKLKTALVDAGPSNPASPKPNK